MKNAGKVQWSVFFTALFAFLCCSLFLARESKAQFYPDTFWVPVTFYDYHNSRGPYTVAAPNGTNPLDTDFTFTGETCVDQNAAGTSIPVVGMVQDTGLSPDRKPLPNATNDCKTAAPLYPCACHLANWFRASGTMNPATGIGYDPNCIFSCDSGQPNPLGGSRQGSSKNPVWYWAQKSGAALPSWKGRTGEFIAPGYDSTNPFANVIIVDSIPFVSVKNAAGANTSEYKFIADVSTPKIAGSHFPHDSFGFFPIDGRGYGSGFPAATITDEPDYYGKATYNHNFGYAMEMHTKVLYQRGQGLKFVFAGDDDVWCFINGKLAIDLGGVKNETADSVFLDSLAGMIDGKYYNFDSIIASGIRPAPIFKSPPISLRRSLRI